ncbi:ADP-ribosylglycohydrolase family protein [Phormidium sp. FACHB-592]|uniref:ADP-ribosylglycohydrolase family protein n=1 Tax=Stenomitos frigidus AS-A4 TaxID=2933935 RepID=A0ABV0KLX8_9CYAN|nr:ADP-ribosylglycohydrolase family protein [Phormidium sp. FACHB-592]MBD2073280.1 ADP-ribosylglycohydrolase family protein [Phormidium sp. FACHB-592]
MRYSLLSRFQGTFWAAALGHELGAYSRSRQAIAKNRTEGSEVVRLAANPTNWHPGLGRENASSSQPSLGGRMAISCARSLVNPGGWHEHALAAISKEFAISAPETSVATGIRSGVLPETIAAELAIATLPVALFFHDDQNRQQQRLLQTVKLWRCLPDVEAGLLAVGYAIAQALQDCLEPQTLLPQIITYLKQSTVSQSTSLPELIGTLEQTQTLVKQGAGLYTAINQIQVRQQTGNEAIALAFYCFLSTPCDLRLALLRAARCGEAAPVIAALTGALGGAYQGSSGLPLAWLATDSQLWGITNTALHELAAHLFAAWSGVYAPAGRMAVAAIAAPGVIRPR